MSNEHRIVLVHATRVAIEPIEEAANRLWPEAEIITILEESLAVDRAKEAELSEKMSNRIISLAKYAEKIGADGVLFTCSAFGEAIESANKLINLPVLKPNESMFEAALLMGDRISMIYTFEPAAYGMEQEFRHSARTLNQKAKIVSHYCANALDAKRIGKGELHDDMIAETASAISNSDVIMLAQFSMASAVDRVRASTDIPVLTSPDAAILKIKSLVEANKRISKTC